MKILRQAEEYGFIDVSNVYGDGNTQKILLKRARISQVLEKYQFFSKEKQYIFQNIPLCQQSEINTSFEVFIFF